MLRRFGGCLLGYKALSDAGLRLNVIYVCVYRISRRCLALFIAEKPLPGGDRCQCACWKKWMKKASSVKNRFYDRV